MGASVYLYVPLVWGLCPSVLLGVPTALMGIYVCSCFWGVVAEAVVSQPRLPIEVEEEDEADLAHL